MRKRTDTPTGRSAGVVGLVVLLLAGCSHASPDTADAAPTAQSAEKKTAATQPAASTTAPATTPPPKPSAPPLPEKATTPWDKLSPAIGKLKNAEPRKLPAPAQRALAEGEEALKDNNIPRAIDRLVRAKGFDRHHPVLLRKLAEAYSRLPNWGKAIDNYEAAAKVSPNDLDLQVALGDALFQQKQTDKALTAYRTALKTDSADPNNPLAAHSLLQAARILEDVGRWQAALDAYTRLNEWLMEHGTAHAQRDSLKEWVTNPEKLLKKRGLLLGKLRQHEKAARLLARAHRRDRGDQQTVVALLEALRQSKQFDRAEKLLVDLLTERTQQSYALSLAESVCVASEDPNMPVRLWEAASEKRFDRDAGIALARAAGKLDNTDAAAEILSDILKQDPTSAEAGRDLITLYLRRDQPADALKLLGSLYTAAPAQTSSLAGPVGRIAAAFSRDAALKAARETLTDESASAGLLHVAGQLAAKHSQTDLATKLFSRSIATDSKFHPAYAAMAEIHLAEGDAEQLRKLDARLDKLTLEKPSPVLMTVRARIQLARQQPASAISTLKKALEENGDYIPAVVLLAEITERRGDTSHAREMLLEALLKAPDDIRLYRGLFDSFLSARRFPEAEAIARRATQRVKPAAEGRILQLRLALAKRDIAAARAQLNELRRELPEDVRVQRLMVEADLADIQGMISRKQYEEFRDRLEKLVKRAPRDADLHKLLAQLYGEANQYSKSLPHWRAAYRLTYGGTSEAMALAAALMEEKKYDDAAGVVAGVMDSAPDNFLLRRMLLDVWNRSEKHDKAVEALRKWLGEEEDPNGALGRWYRFRLLQAMRDADKHKDALEFITAELKKEGADQEALRSERLHVLADQGKFKDLLAEAKDWAADLAKQADDTDDPRRQGELLESRRYVQRLSVALLSEEKKYTLAQSLLDDWIGEKTDASVEHLRALKIILYGEAGAIPAAEQYAAEWIKQSPAALTPRQSLVGVLEQNRKTPRALELVQEWIPQIKVPQGPVIRHRGEAETLRWCKTTEVILLVETGKPRKALEAVEKYLKDYKNDPRLLRYRAVALGELGREKEEIAVLEQLFNLDKDDPGINNDLGYTYADAGIHLEKAERMVRLALSYRPGTTAFQDSLGWVLYKQGRFSEAAEVLRRVVEDPDFVDSNDPTEAHPVIFDHAGDALYRLGWTDRAKAMWQKAIDMGLKMKDRSEEVKAVMISAEAKLVALKENRRPPVADTGKKDED